MSNLVPVSYYQTTPALLMFTMLTQCRPIIVGSVLWVPRKLKQPKQIPFKHLRDDIKVSIIEKQCLKLYDFTPAQIRHKSRKREIVVTRQLIMYFVHQFTKLSLAKNGALVGKTHGTVLHAIKTITNLAETDKQFRAKLERIKDEIEKS
jgi:chromosomal replication initiation ATPase DnaA